ncbi:MAG: type II toxin-antitoxin system PemK/MazF family toxin [Bacteroidota bacterium]
MTTYSPGDSVLVPFPFTDLTTIKQRPAVVISSHEFNASHNDLIVVAITSQQPYNVEADEFLLADEEQRNAGLPKPSKVKCGKILSID